MRSQITVWITLTLCSLSLPSAFAEDKANESSTSSTSSSSAPVLTPEKKALIKELLVESDADKNVHTIVDTLMQAQREQYPKILKSFVDAETNLTDEQKKDIMEHTQERSERAATRMKEIFDKNIDLANVMDSVAYKVYDKYFTDAELKDIIAYYKTPTGKKALRVMPQLMKESMEDAREIIAPQLQKCIVQFIDEERKSLHPGETTTK